MPGVKVFRCPSCGASVSTDGEEAQITCQFCGTTIVVPEELRVKRPTPPQPKASYIPDVKVIVTDTPIISVSDSAGRSGMLITAIIGVVVACVTLGIVAAVLTGVGGAAIGLAPAVSTTVSSLPTAGVAATKTPAASPTPGFATLALTFGGEGTGPGKFDDPRSIAVDGQGNVYVGEYSVARVQKFDADGQFITSWMTEARVESAPLRNLAADRNGNVYVVRSGQILKYDGASGDLLATFDDEVGFDDVVVLPDGRLLACACFGGNDLVFLDADGTPGTRISSAITSLTGDTVSNLRVAVDGLGTIYVLSQKDSAVFKFSPDGQYQDRFGGDGDEPGQLRAPGGIAVDGQGRVYVSDFKGIQVFTADGQYIDVFDVPQGAVFGMAFNDQGALYATSNSNEIYKFEFNNR
jgi:DNA-directed RNA polymerase subunit RPC12/RpoP